MTQRQERFIEEYLVDLNAAAAARRAGFSPNTAKSSACRLMKDPEIRSRIEQARQAQAQRAQVRADEVIAELKGIAFAQAEGTALNGKLRALELLGKHLGLFEGRPELAAGQVRIVEDI